MSLEELVIRFSEIQIYWIRCLVSRSYSKEHEKSLKLTITIFFLGAVCHINSSCLKVVWFILFVSIFWNSVVQLEKYNMDIYLNLLLQVHLIHNPKWTLLYGGAGVCFCVCWYCWGGGGGGIHRKIFLGWARHCWSCMLLQWYYQMNIFFSFLEI